MISSILSIISILALITLLLSAIAFFRTQDTFTASHIVMICGYYVMPLALITIGMHHLSFASIIKISLLIILSIVGSNLICYLTSQKAVSSGQSPDVVAKMIED